MSHAHLPDDREQAFRACGLTVLERGWLSSNMVLLRSERQCALVDSGYASHAAQSLALVRHELAGQALDLLVNTHLHSDHCGGNAALQAQYPAVRTAIPPGLSEAVAVWDEERLSYSVTGQECPRFAWTDILRPGSECTLGALSWQVHAAPGHDPDAVLLFQADTGVLMSADALWENGFGVVFPELDGIHAFDEVGATLDLIEQLRPRHIIPGHGRPFSEVGPALDRARSRLEQFQKDPAKHRRYAIKVLLKFRLLDWQRIRFDELLNWACRTPYLRRQMGPAAEDRASAAAWLQDIVADLVRSGAAERSGDDILDR